MSNSFSKPEHFSILHNVTITPTQFSFQAVNFTPTHKTARKFNLAFNATLISRDFLATGGETVRLAWFTRRVLSYSQHTNPSLHLHRTSPLFQPYHSYSLFKCIFSQLKFL